MKVVVRWGAAYLFLLMGLTVFGYYNLQRQNALEVLRGSVSELERRETRLTLMRYDLLSPLALRQWAEQNGYIPMSLAQWERTAP